MDADVLLAWDARAALIQMGADDTGRLAWPRISNGSQRNFQKEISCYFQKTLLAALAQQIAYSPFLSPSISFSCASHAALPTVALSAHLLRLLYMYLSMSAAWMECFFDFLHWQLDLTPSGQGHVGRARWPPDDIPTASGAWRRSPRRRNGRESGLLVTIELRRTLF